MLYSFHRYYPPLPILDSSCANQLVILKEIPCCVFFHMAKPCPICDLEVS